MEAARTLAATGAQRTALPLLDRQAELSALGDAIAATAAGEGRVVLVEGTPGVGKTRLLAEARRLLDAAGLRVLPARGGEIEREHPYGVVRQLFESALLGPEPVGWMRGPAAPATSVFRPDAAVDPDAFTTLGGLYWLTVNAATEGPLALVVDDLHWVDRPSLHYLQYLVRRIEGVPVLVVLGGRPDESDLLADITTAPATSRLRPAPLSARAAGLIAQELLGVRPAAHFAEACWRATSGNPLLLVELLRALRAEGIAPDDANVEMVDQVGPSAVARIALVRLRRLGAQTIAVAQAVAILGEGAASPLIAELAEVEDGAVSPAVAALIEAEILDAEPPLGFVHPVVRDAVYAELTPDARDRRHARAAELLHARAADADVVGAHLLLAAPRGERWIVTVLRSAAADAAARGAVETALTFLRRALAERPGDADPELQLQVGLAEGALDPAAAVGHLEAARRSLADEARRAWVGELITRLLVFDRPADAIAAARRTREELPPGLSDTAAALVAVERWAGRFTDADPAPAPTPVPAGARGRMLMAVQAWELALAGAPAETCVAQAASALLLDAPAGSGPVFTQNGLLTAMIGSTVLLLADDERAQHFWDAWQTEAEQVGRVHAVIAGAIWQAMLHLRRGELPGAEAAMRMAIEGPRRWGPGTETASPASLGLLAEILIERGDLAGAHELIDAVPGRHRPTTEGELHVRCRELRLLVLEGRHAEALDGFEGVRARLETVRNPAWYPWRSIRAAALAGLGRGEEAMATATEELELARSWGTPGPIARALTLTGELTGRVEDFEEAVALSGGPLARLEHARALLALGGAVRRRGQPREARAHLRDAHDLALRCGAAPIARAARDELAAAGGRPRAVSGSGPDALTPSERRVAELAAAGRRNQDIAQQLFLSPKTIEVHLSSAYRKLGIRARGELGAALGVERRRPSSGR
ncbi:AAA family ATPase [Paraconexibacter antarcticus]|uniref:AAA family ATPase n=1 Tax=Paraconexibacter antarcticus TaxID=2949664 RepID=A0ABY5DSA3_9ACTN|nr:AAA family ATPase [Paraconexibacter antarcticus]UTI63794.1 AAA family ATPase [Paraconexibacter antarcticus]